MAEQFSIPTVGDLIAGKYRVEKELGRGAYGVVFRADQEELGRHVAVKTLLPQAFLQQDIVQRFHREAQLISRLDHPNIIRLYDYGVDEGLLYMAVEYVEGRTLMDLIEKDAPLEPERVRQISLQILDALVHAHGQGIVHRDLKPENIVLLQTRTTDGREYEVVKILDFGISKLLRGENDAGALKSLTQDGTVLGTPHYMSPENIVGDPIDHRADIYAFGVILYELLTGVHPFDAPSPSAVMVRHLRDPLPPLPPELDGTSMGIAIQRCLEKQPWDRIGSAAEVIELLEATDAGHLAKLSKRPSRELRGPVDPDATVLDPPQQAPAKQPGVGAFAGGIVLVALIVVVVGVWISGQVKTPTQPQPTATAAQLKSADVGVAVVPPPRQPPSPDLGVAMVFPAEPDAGSPAADAPQDEPSERVPEVTKKPPREPREPREKQVEGPTTVELDVTSVPTNANVIVDGVPIGSTPLRRAFPVDKPVEIRFSHIGYKEKILTLSPNEESGAIRADLEKDHLRLID